MDIRPSRPVYSVPPVTRAIRLLRHIADGDGAANMSQSARALKISRTTLMRLLMTLEAEGMIERRGDGAGFRLGLGLAGLAGQALFSSDIVEAGEPAVAQLTERLGLSSHLGVLDGREVLYVARRTPNLHLISNVRVGSRLPAHATSMGRIILAFMPRESVEASFAGQELKAATAKTPVTLASLLKLIDADRKAGLAWSDSHFEPGIASVAAAVFNRAGAVAGAVNVTGPASSFDSSAGRRTDIEAAIRAASSEISRRLGYTGAHQQRTGT